jgi:hypothetical protein
MGERTGRIDLSDNHKTRPSSPDEAVRLLGAEIAELREELGGLVTELDRRRHDLLDVKLQFRRHVFGATVTAVTLIGAIAGVIWFGISRSKGTF